jgi:hypothetical protein
MYRARNEINGIAASLRIDDCLPENTISNRFLRGRDMPQCLKPPARTDLELENRAVGTVDLDVRVALLYAERNTGRCFLRTDRKHLMHESIIEGVRRMDRWSVPLVAIREALMNGHRPCGLRLTPACHEAGLKAPKL